MPPRGFVVTIRGHCPDLAISRAPLSSRTCTRTDEPVLRADNAGADRNDLTIDWHELAGQPAVVSTNCRDLDETSASR